jgi:glycosyltransferase involved in cell wall biosynthesis
MKILLANKFYYPRGGDCIYTINLKNLLEQHHHEVAVFSMQHPENRDTPYKKYFPSEVSFSNKRHLLKFLLRPFGTKEVRKKFTQLLDDFQPDVVHLNNIHTQLSPVIARIAHKRGIKVIWTLHDYKLLCPRYDCLRNDHIICERCFSDKKQALINRCMKNSLIGSIIAYLEAKKWSKKKLEQYTDLFICPSQFMADKMQQGGFDKDKMITLHNFIDTEKIGKTPIEKGNYYCYLGRLSYEKGIGTLLQSAKELPYPLKIIGDGPLKENTIHANIDFLGRKPWDDIKEIVGNARFSVIPSECYENNPLSGIESLCLGTPVVGSNVGGIPELLQTHPLNRTFQMGNQADLQEKIQFMWNRNLRESDYSELAGTSQDRFSAEKYYLELLKIYHNK